MLELFCEDKPEEPLLWLDALLNDDEGWVLELFPDEDGVEDCDDWDEPEDCEGCEDWLRPLELLRPELLFTGPLLEDEGGGGIPLDEDEGGGGTALLDDEAGGIKGELELEAGICVFLVGERERWFC